MRLRLLYLRLVHTARFLSLATKILSSVVSDENLDIEDRRQRQKSLICVSHTQQVFVVSDKNLRPQRQKSSSSATKIVFCALGFKNSLRISKTENRDNLTILKRSEKRGILIKQECVLLYGSVIFQCSCCRFSYRKSQRDILLQIFYGNLFYVVILNC